MTKSLSTFPHRSGFLHKKGRINTAFQSRWFVLSEGELCYFKKVPGGSEEANPQGKISLPLDTTVAPKYFEKFPYGFVISVGHRTYCLAAPTYEERLEWMADIKQTIEALRHLGKQPLEQGTTPTSQTPNPEPNTLEEVSTTSSSVIPHIAGTTGSSTYQTLVDDQHLGDFGKGVNPLVRLLALTCPIALALILFIVLAVFFTTFVFVLFVMVVAVWFMFSYSQVRSALSTTLLTRRLDSLGSSVSRGQKTAPQAQAEAVLMFETYSKYLTNSDVMHVFFHLRLFTKQGTKWQFVRQEQSGSVWQVITGGYGRTSTYRKIIKSLQDQAIVNYNRVHGSSLVCEGEVEDTDWAGMDDSEDIKVLLRYNPSRIPLGAVFGDRTDELID